jgi:hypothetical protein
MQKSRGQVELMRISKLKIAFLVLFCVAGTLEWWHFRSVSGSARQTAPLAQKKRPDFVLLPATEITNAANLFGNLKSPMENWEPTVADINDLESSLPQITALSSKEPNTNRHIDNPDQYFRQYLAVMIHGQKQVLVNAMCTVEPGQDWRRRLTIVSDGGKCFWHAVFDPTTQTFSNLVINGRA